MSICLRKILLSPKNLSLSRKTSLRFFSFISPVNCKLVLNNTNKPSFSKINWSKQIQHRNFTQYLQSVFDSVRSSEASKLVKTILVETHDFTGLPWYVTIIGASLLMKVLISFPCGIYQQYLISKLKLTKLELNNIVNNLKEKYRTESMRKKLTKKKLESEFRREVRMNWNTLVVKNNCHPFKITILFFVQLPFWLLLTVTIKTFGTEAYMMQSEHPKTALQFKVGGPFWCQNLTAPDPFYILPATNFLAMLACTEVSYLQSIGKISEKNVNTILPKIVPYLGRIFAVVFFFISAASPAGLSLFWASNSIFALGFNLFILLPKARRFFRIPRTPSELSKPYSDLWNTLVGKLTKIFKK